MHIVNEMEDVRFFVPDELFSGEVEGAGGEAPFGIFIGDDLLDEV